jgi:hypothetical protein
LGAKHSLKIPYSASLRLIAPKKTAGPGAAIDELDEFLLGIGCVNGLNVEGQQLWFVDGILATSLCTLA